MGGESEAIRSARRVARSARMTWEEAARNGYSDRRERFAAYEKARARLAELEAAAPPVSEGGETQ